VPCARRRAATAARPLPRALERASRERRLHPQRGDPGEPRRSRRDVRLPRPVPRRRDPAGPSSKRRWAALAAASTRQLAEAFRRARSDGSALPVGAAPAECGWQTPGRRSTRRAPNVAACRSVTMRITLWPVVAAVCRRSLNGTSRRSNRGEVVGKEWDHGSDPPAHRPSGRGCRGAGDAAPWHHQNPEIRTDSLTFACTAAGSWRRPARQRNEPTRAPAQDRRTTDC
jgi:hypothetical protein